MTSFLLFYILWLTYENCVHKFNLLSAEDQQFILDTCSKNTYAEAVEVLQQPRPAGLGIETSATALCRWFTSHNPDAASTRALGQLSKAIQVRHQFDASGHMQALLALVQNRLLQSLSNGKALADLTPAFRILFQMHKTFLADHKWRQSSGQRVTEADYNEFIKDTCEMPGVDFIHPDESAEDIGITDTELTTLLWNDTEDEVRSAAALAVFAHESQKTGAERRLHAAGIPITNPGTFYGAKGNPESPQPPSQTPAAPLVFPSVAAQFAGPVPQSSAIFQQKTPVIPPIPPNSTSAKKGGKQAPHGPR